MQRVKPEHPHWPLVVMTVLTQLSVGAFAAIWLLQIARRVGAAEHRGTWIAARLAAWRSAHPPCTWGGPIHAYRALEDVAALVAQPRSADVQCLLRMARYVCGLVAV